MAVTLTNLISLVREYLSSPSSSQISDSTITTEINNYYQNLMPLQIDLPELKGSFTITTADTETSGDIDDDTLKINPPVRIGSGASPSSYAIGGFFYEPAHFYARHNGSETKGTPVDVLLIGRTVHFAPAADGVYQIVFPSSINKPTALSDGADEIVQDRLRDLIAASASVIILSRRKDTESQKALLDFVPFYVQVLKSLGIDTDMERAMDSRNSMKAPVTNA